TAAPATVPKTTTTAKTPLPEFGPGTRLVGKEIAPGRYLSAGGEGCYYARLKDLSGSLDGIIANDNPTGQAIVDIAPTDVAFQSRDCAPWIAFIAATQVQKFGDGDWAVNFHIKPGRWRAPGGDGCYWARLSDFSHTVDSIIANDNASGPVVVDIAPTDIGFETTRCGTWTRAG